ncbi:MAG TPA: hypothetical protein VNI81_13370 [Candidatus Limnocylindrales bacterium]|nr:hypothetical protein [Candidatus Limnocylindrales bacterium]
MYKSQLGELQTTLGQIRVMLLARQASLEAGRATFRRVAVDGRFPANALRISDSCKVMEIPKSNCWHGRNAIEAGISKERMTADQAQARKTG